MFVSDPLDLISEGREKLAAEDPSGWSSAALSDRMLAVAAERERLDAEFVRLAAEWDARGAWGEDGFVSASAWLAANARMAKSAAGRMLRAARHVHRFETTADALADGMVTAEKVDALAETARHREEFYARDESLLLDAAARLDVRDLTVVLRTWRNLADDALAAEDAADAFARVHLDVANGLLGAELVGFLDPEGTALLVRALDVAEPPDVTTGPDAPRSTSQRRGEGLVKLARHFLDGRGGSRHSGHRAGARAVPSISVVFAPPSAARQLEDHRCELSGFGSVPLDTVRRLACEARTGWLVIDGRREVLDMGRAVRTPTAAQRRAVAARDRHCRYPGCRAPAEWCDLHHLIEWERGGLTDVADLVLLCRRHHHALHEGRRLLVRDPDGTVRVERGVAKRRTRWGEARAAALPRTFARAGPSG
jgi:hypothetical protein